MTGNLGIVDWGIGGLGVVSELRALCTEKGLVLPAISYLSDTAAAPYGTLSARTLEARLRLAIGFLRDRGASRILLACNAASTALPRLSDLDDVRGVIAPTLELISESRKSARIVVIGGRRTILSRVYASALRARGFDVVQRIAQPLSGFIERGEQSSPAFEQAVSRILRPVMHYNALVLACTHYPAALPTFEKHFTGQVINPLPAIARACCSTNLSRRDEDDAFFTTGDTQAMKLAAAKAWQIEITAKKAEI
ncbi:MAG: aspartate/glutamate racemase family protein [Polyangiaceae bacterium]